MGNPVQRDLLVEVAFGADLGAAAGTWTWTDVSADLLAQSMGISRGRADESGETQPMSTSLQLDNIRGDYTPGNPVGAYYPNVKRGAPLRISAPAGSFFRSGEPQTAVVSTPDAAALDITGDIDVRVEFRDIAGDAVQRSLIHKWGAIGQRSWRLHRLGETVWFAWSANGSAFTNVTPTVAPILTDRIALRVTFDVNNGAGGNTTTFYTAASIDGPWTQLGAPVVNTGTTTIFNSSAPLALGAGGGSSDAFIGRIWGARVYDGIGGTLVADADFRDVESGTTAFTDPVGRSWSVAGGGAIVLGYSQRFIGHVDEWAPSWPVGDVTGEQAPHAVVDVTASSVRRRLLQGNTVVSSPIRAALPAARRANRPLVAYWPMEDGPDAKSFGSAVSGAPAMAFLGSPRPASSADYIASEPLPTFNAAGAFGGVPTYTGTQWQVSCVIVMPESGVPNGAVLLDIRTDGTAARYLVKYDTGGAGQIRLQVYSSASPPVELLNVAVAAPVAGRPFMLYIEGGNSGANALYTIGTVIVTDFSTAPTLSAPSGSIAGRTAPRVTAVGVGTHLDLSNDIAIGHVAVYGAIQVFFHEPRVYQSLIANAGESAVDRFIRLCDEARVSYSVHGGTTVTSEPMGAQRTLDLMSALAECAETDAGILLDRMDVPGLLFRPRTTLYRQEPDLVLDAAVNGIANPFQPVLDDQRIRNDITVTRAEGSSASAVDEASVAAEGRYDDSLTLSLFTDQQAVSQAWWRLHLGTVAGMRYSAITVDFDTAPTDALRTWLADVIDVGDLVRIRNLPRQHAPDDVDLLVQGYTETVSQTRWQVTFNCSPAAPYRIGTYSGTGTRLTRYGSGRTTLAEHLDADETDIDISTPSGPVWTTNPAHYPLDVVIGGERITVGGCTGTGAAQTFTGCVRSVNGVTKTHSIGVAVELFQLSYYGL